MKRLIATALLSLLALGLGMGQARAGGCGYQICAAQYNAFSPFCAPALAKKGLFCKKCCYVLECCPAPVPCYPVDCVPGCETGVPADGHPVGSAPASGAPSGGAAPTPAPAGGAGFQAPTPTPAGPNTSMMRLPYGAPQPVTYLPGYQPAYGYPQAPVMAPGMAAMTTQGMVPMNAVPWHGSPPAGR